MTRTVLMMIHSPSQDSYKTCCMIINKKTLLRACEGDTPFLHSRALYKREIKYFRQDGSCQLEVFLIGMFEFVKKKGIVNGPVFNVTSVSTHR